MSFSRQPASAGLPGLPLDVLRLIWGHLADRAGPQARTAPTVPSQHALRCTCTQLRDSTTPFISTLLVDMDRSGQGGGAPSAVLQDCQRQLAAFPAAATPTALRWQFGADIRRPWSHPHAKLPEVLPEFLGSGRSRLANVTSVAVGRNLVLGFGEVSSLVCCCPHLSCLTFTYVAVNGLALAPLAYLSGLRALSLQDVDASGSTPHDLLYSPLSLLSTLTSFEARTAAVEHVLPHISGLTSLRSLHLHDMRLVSDDDAVFSHASRLTQLTALAITFEGGHPKVGPGLALPAHHQLVILDLTGVVLQTAAIRTIAALPRLAELTAESLQPDCDLSSLACSFTKLAMSSINSLPDFARLPLRSLTLLILDDSPEWELDLSDMAGSSALLRRGCQALARAFGHDLFLHLSCTRVLPSVSTAPLLAALTPLQHLPHSFQLSLSEGWAVGCEHVNQLAAHLPRLSKLWVEHADNASFVGFATAVATRLPQLRELEVGQGDLTGKLPRGSQDALLALASVRAVAGPPLTISLYQGGMSAALLQHCNAVVDMLRGGVGRTQHNAVLFC